jgi:hypothetical protein
MALVWPRIDIFFRSESADSAGAVCLMIEIGRTAQLSNRAADSFDE